MLDHLGELRYSSGRKDRFDLDVTEGLSDLRSIAKEHGVPVVVANHLRRDVSQNQRAPRLTDFANSSAIERQARVALALERAPGSDVLKIHVLKQTNGKAGVVVEVRFAGPAALVRDDAKPTDEYATIEEAAPPPISHEELDKWS